MSTLGFGCFGRYGALTATRLHCVAELGALFGCHLCPTTSHAATVTAMASEAEGTAKAAKQEPAERQQAKGLPEADYRQRENLWHQKVPELPNR